MSSGLTLYDTEICNINISDLMPVIFEFPLSCQPVRCDVPKYQSRMITADKADCFVCSYKNSNHAVLSNRSSYLTTVSLLSLFISTCLEILDSIALLKTRCLKPKTHPWLHNDTREIRQVSRKAEQKGQTSGII